MSNNSFKQSKFLPYLMWCIPMMFFAHQFILRLWPGLMMPQIISHFSIDAKLFGTLAASYYVGYAGMQIPVAILLDRYGARVIVCLFATICGLAAIVFSYTSNFYVAVVSRFLIGASSAAGFLSVSKVISEWFDAKFYTKMVGFSLSFGILGAVYGGKPVGLLIERYEPNHVAYMIGVISILTGLFAYLFLRSPKNNTEEKEEKLLLSSLKSIISNKVILLIAVSNLLLVGPLEGFADAWGVQYLVTSYNILKSDAAGIISFIFIGMLFGGPVLAFMSQKMGDYLVMALTGLVMAFVIFLMLGNFLDLTLLKFGMFLIGVMCCYQVLVFSLGSKLVAKHNAGICIAFLNSVNMLGGSFYHTLIGFTMNAFPRGSTDNVSTGIYHVKSYQYALSVIPICSVIGSLILICLYIVSRRTKSF